MKPLVIDCCSFSCVGLEPIMWDRPRLFLALIICYGADKWTEDEQASGVFVILICWWLQASLNRDFSLQTGILPLTCWLNGILVRKMENKASCMRNITLLVVVNTPHILYKRLHPPCLTVPTGASCQGDCLAKREWGRLKCRCQAMLTARGCTQSQELLDSQSSTVRPTFPDTRQKRTFLFFLL